MEGRKIATKEQLFAIIRRRKKRGPWYGTTRSRRYPEVHSYRRYPTIRPSRVSGYANLWHSHRSSQKWVAEYMRTNGPGTIFGDLFAARRGDGAAAERLAERLYSHWALKAGSLERTALIKLAHDEESNWKRVKLRCLQRAVVLVTQYATKEVFIRAHDGYVTSDAGTEQLFVPYEFTVDLYWEWVQLEVPRAARADLLGIAYLPDKVDVRTRNALNNAVPLGKIGDDVAIDDPLSAILASIEREQTLQDIWARASVTQRAFIEAYLATGTGAAAARKVGKTPEAGDQIMRRIRKHEKGRRSA